MDDLRNSPIKGAGILLPFIVAPCLIFGPVLFGEAAAGLLVYSAITTPILLGCIREMHKRKASDKSFVPSDGIILLLIVAAIIMVDLILLLCLPYI